MNTDNPVPSPEPVFVRITSEEWAQRDRLPRRPPSNFAIQYAEELRRLREFILRLAQELAQSDINETRDRNNDLQ